MLFFHGKIKYNKIMKENDVVNKEKLLIEIDGLITRYLTDNTFKTAAIKQSGLVKRKSRTTKQQKTYQVIGKLIEQKYGYRPISDPSLWRLLKIKETYPAEYKKIIAGKITIRASYEKLFGKKINNTANKQNVSYDNYDFDADPNFEYLLNFLKKVNDQITDKKDSLSVFPNMKTLKDLDNEIFKLRKNTGKIIMWYDETDEPV